MMIPRCWPGVPTPHKNASSMCEEYCMCLSFQGDESEVSTLCAHWQSSHFFHGNSDRALTVTRTDYQSDVESHMVVQRQRRFYTGQLKTQNNSVYHSGLTEYSESFLLEPESISVPKSRQFWSSIWSSITFWLLQTRDELMNVRPTQSVFFSGKNTAEEADFLFTSAFI